MKTPIKIMLSALVLGTLFFTSCTQEEMSPEPTETLALQQGEVNGETPDGIQGTANVLEIAEDLYALSWIIEDDVVIQKTGIESPVVTLIVKENRVHSLYLSSETLEYIVIHDDLLLKQDPQGNIIVIQDDVMLRTATEDRNLIELDEGRNIVIIENDVMLNLVIENDIMLNQGYVDNVELRYIIAEDEVMLLTFSQEGEDLFTSSLTIRDDIF